VRRLAAISGAIASGKSELARELTKTWNCPRASFGAFVMTEATRRTLPTDRDTLQQVGPELIEQLGWEEFCARTLRLAGASWESDSVVVDGIRHLEAIDTLRAGFRPVPIPLVYVACDSSTRLARQLARGATRAEVERWEADLTEQAQAMLRASADLVVCGDGSLASAVSAVTQLVDGPAPDG